MKRVSKSNPCPRCGKDSWCFMTESSVLCMRDNSGRPFVLKSGETGYWHDLDGIQKREFKSQAVQREPEIDAGKIMGKWRNETRPGDFAALAKSLGVTGSSVLAIGAAWAKEHHAWAFPMRDGNGRQVGIRLRAMNGKKWCVKGSKTGVFLPWGNPERTVYLPEGPTDVCALLSIGLYAIGRPSNSGGLLDIKNSVRRLGIQKAVIIADNDDDKFMSDGRKFNPGYDGAESLARHIGIPCCILSLPTKDMRQFVNEGGTSMVLDALTAGLVWQNLPSAWNTTPPAPRSLGAAA